MVIKTVKKRRSYGLIKLPTQGGLEKKQFKNLRTFFTLKDFYHKGLHIQRKQQI